MSVTRSSRRPNPWWVAIVAGMASYIDAAAIVSFGIVLTIYAATLGFDPGQVGIAAGALTFGIAVGAVVGGQLGDRFGRKPVFSVTMGVIIVGALVGMFATSFAPFLAGAVLVGLGTGADLPVSLSTISEAGDDSNRGRLVSLSNILWMVGIVVAILGGTFFGNLGYLGGQILLGHLVVISVLVLIARLWIPESDVWLRARAERASGAPTLRARNSTVRELLGSRYRAPFLALIVFYALVNLSANTAGQFGTYLLVNEAGTDVSTASSISLLIFPVSIAAMLVFLKVADSRRRFSFFTFGAVLYVASLLVPAIFGFTVTTFLVSGFAGAIGMAFSFETIMKVWAQKSFPTLLRTTAQGTIIAVARFSAAILATFTPLILQAGVQVLYIFLASVSLVGMVVAWSVFRTYDRRNEFLVEDDVADDVEPEDAFMSH
ncbi:MFS transporter [Tessaracoccus sp. OS52]|uniref:MFS transporter n=1 Tax=Tessaracoccus sp. OS52 TaxID=2886691 RepID=UPI001D10E9D3|nr:MFS transporter [Tessaracoccus sp. OS52]MCC2591863.1 MFS transporter [Tessaracoccus sp. OS52]